jgi:exonuclease VII small subunit
MSSKSKKTISQKIEELRQMAAWFESDDFDIEQAIERYQAAEKLAGEIEKDLDGLRNKVTILKEKFA